MIPRILPLLALLLAIGCAKNDEANQATVLSEGQFVDKGGQHTSGTYRLQRAGETMWLVLASDFRTDEGPDLHVLLSPLEVDSAMNENGAANALVLAPLQAQTGEQVYAVPDAVDLGAYKTVLIHCIEFSHLYGAAPLSVAGM
jgi:hypothetical protein